MIEMKGIHKSFGSNDVLKDIDFTLKNGEIVALLGENGAGKSTLMNILGGILPQDQGKIVLDGEIKEFNSPSESLHQGIAFIHQELNLVNDLSIYENMYLGNEIKKNRFMPDQESMIKNTQEILDMMDIDLDPKALVGSLDASYKQIIEICRALLMNAKYIIMDEPTTSLTGPEIERVFAMMRRLKKDGVGIIFISHKLNEVMDICDSFVVLRNGNLIISDSIENTSTDKIAEHMVGHEVSTQKMIKETKIGDVVLDVKNLSNDTHYHDVNLHVRKGEVLGVTGLLGDGRSELFLSLFGDTKPTTGTIEFDGKEYKVTTIPKAISKGIGYLPRNRKENSIIKDMNILENGTLTALNRFMNKIGMIDGKQQKEAFITQKENLQVKMGQPKDSINSLSGGNQQKVVLGKWLMVEPKLLILDNPTQGVDVGAKDEIYQIIHEIANQGSAVIVLSSEPQEVIRICDRVNVMYHGHIQGELLGEDINEKNIMKLATGNILG